MLGVGIVGFGLSGSLLNAPVIQSVPGLELRAIASQQGEKVRAQYPSVAFHNDAKELFQRPDIDLVVIATPNQYHYPLSRDALTAGKHVVVEKPFVVSSRDGEELIQIAKQKGKVLSVYHNRRWDNGFLTLKKCIEEGSLGEIVGYESSYNRFRPDVNDKKWKETKGPGSGLLHDLGSHLIDQAVSLFGAPLWVNANLMLQRPNALVDDGFYLMMGYKQLWVTIRASNLGCPDDSYIKAFGRKGSFIKYHLDTQDMALLSRQPLSDPAWGSETENKWGTLYRWNGTELVPSKVPSIPGNYKEFYRQIHEAITAGKPNPVPPEEALISIKIIESAVKSSEQKAAVTFSAA